MANNCFYQMQVRGPEANVREFISKMSSSDKDCYPWRVFSASVGSEDLEEESLENKVTGRPILNASIEGDCAWSIQSSMRRYAGIGREPSLESVSKDLDLQIEAYSEECGAGFQEHLFIDKGDVLVDECVDWSSECIEDMDEEEILDTLERLKISREELDENAVEGYYSIGGFPDWNFTCFE